MQISWNGFGSYTFNIKTGQGDVTLVTNPFASEAVKFPRSIAASIVVSSHEGGESSSLEAITAEYPEDKRCPFIIAHAGEFEVRGVAVTGVHVPRKDGTPHTIYRIDAETLSIGFLGALDRKLTDKEVETLGNIDVLIVPAGGKDVLTASGAAEAVAVIEPRIIIPSYVSGEGVATDYAEADAFCRELGSPTESTPKLKLTRAILPEEDMKIITITKS